MSLEVDENTVKAIHEDISKVIANHLNLTTDEVGSLFIACKGSWDMAFKVVYIMKKKGIGFVDAINVYKEYMIHRLKNSTGRR